MDLKWRREKDKNSSAVEFKHKDSAAEDHHKAAQNDDFLAARRAHFEYARYHNYCRTAAFCHADDDEGRDAQWLKAVEDPQSRRWHILEINFRSGFVTDDNPEGAPVCKQEPYAHDLTFIAMVEKLAEFENTRPDLEYKMATDAGDDLPEGYFRQVAEDEGIIFDSEGKPHPTMDGLIVTPGLFPEDAETKARARAAAPPRAPAAGKALVVEFNESAHLEAVDKLLESYDVLSALDEFTGYLKILQNITEYYRTHFDGTPKNYEQFSEFFGLSDEDGDLMRREFDQDDAQKNYSDFCFQTVKARALSCAGTAIVQESMPVIEAIIDRQNLCYEIVRAHALMKLVYQGHDQSRAFGAQYKESLKEIDTLTDRLGEGTEEANYYKALTTTEGAIEIPESLRADSLRERCQQLEQQKMREIIVQKEKMARAPAPPSFGKISGKPL